MRKRGRQKERERTGRAKTILAPPRDYREAQLLAEAAVKLKMCHGGGEEEMIERKWSRAVQISLEGISQNDDVRRLESRQV